MNTGRGIQEWGPIKVRAH